MRSQWRVIVAGLVAVVLLSWFLLSPAPSVPAPRMSRPLRPPSPPPSSLPVRRGAAGPSTGPSDPTVEADRTQPVAAPTVPSSSSWVERVERFYAVIRNVCVRRHYSQPIQLFTVGSNASAVAKQLDDLQFQYSAWNIDSRHQIVRAKAEPLQGSSVPDFEAVTAFLWWKPTLYIGDNCFHMLADYFFPLWYRVVQTMPDGFNDAVLVQLNGIHRAPVREVTLLDMQKHLFKRIVSPLEEVGLQPQCFQRLVVARGEEREPPDQRNNQLKLGDRLPCPYFFSSNFDDPVKPRQNGFEGMLAKFTEWAYKVYKVPPRPKVDCNFTRVVYAPRRVSNQMVAGPNRAIVNLDEFLSWVKLELGNEGSLEVIDFKDVPDLVRKVAHANVYTSMHSADICNVVFASPPTIFYEIQYRIWQNRVGLNMANMQDIPYYGMSSEEMWIPPKRVGMYNGLRATRDFAKRYVANMKQAWYEQCTRGEEAPHRQDGKCEIPELMEGMSTGFEHSRCYLTQESKKNDGIWRMDVDFWHHRHVTGPTKGAQDPN